jgi:hypothetical protein
MKNTDPLMGAKLKSKTHLQNTFFDFLSRFLRVWLQSLKKVLISYYLTNFFLKKSKRCQKTQNFTLISNPLNKLLKFTVPKKVISKTSLTNMSKIQKSFRHIFANNFILVHFLKLKTAQKNEKSFFINVS